MPVFSNDRYLILLVSDAVSAMLAVVLALWTWSLTAGFDINSATLVRHAPWFLFVPLWVVGLSPSRHPRTAFDASRSRRAVANTALTLLVGYLLIYFVIGPQRLPRLLAMYLLWNAVWLTWTSRLAAQWLLTRRSFVRPVALIGDDADRQMLEQLMTVPAMADARIVDAVTTAPDVIVTTSRRLTTSEIDQLFRRQQAGARIATLVDLYESVSERVPVLRVGDDWVVLQLLAGARAHAVSPLAIRGADVVGAVGLLVIGAVPMLIAALAVVMESGWPAFYTQVRVGQDGRLFRIIKIRSMRHDAERDGAQWSGAADPRVTRVGRWLRKTHIDELPNAWAVLVGHMSLVGPRPERPEFIPMLQEAIPLYRARFAVKPGLTGWAQVNSDYGDSIEAAITKLEYDLYYVRHRSLLFNLRILVRTVARMLGMRGR